MSEELLVFPMTGVSVHACWSLVRAGSYAARVYAMERDVAGAFSAPAFAGTGLRWYLLLRASVARGMTVSGRYAETDRSAGPVRILTEPAVTLQCDLDIGLLTAD